MRKDELVVIDVFTLVRIDVDKVKAVLLQEFGEQGECVSEVEMYAMGVGGAVEELVDEVFHLVIRLDGMYFAPIAYGLC